MARILFIYHILGIAKYTNHHAKIEPSQILTEAKHALVLACAATLVTRKKNRMSQHDSKLTTVKKVAYSRHHQIELNKETS